MIIKKELDAKTLEYNTELLIRMIVEETDKSSKDTSVLILKLPTHDPSKKPLIFKKEFYTAIYPKTGTKTIQFDSPIEFNDLSDTKGIQIVAKGKVKTINTLT